MFQFPAFALLTPMHSGGSDWGSPQPSFLIRKSPDQRSFASFPELIAGYHVFRRLSMPRHPPYTLRSLTTFIDHRHGPGRRSPSRRSPVKTSRPPTTADPAPPAGVPDGRYERPITDRSFDRGGSSSAVSRQKRCSTTPARGHARPRSRAGTHRQKDQPTSHTGAGIAPIEPGGCRGGSCRPLQTVTNLEPRKSFTCQRTTRLINTVPNGTGSSEQVFPPNAGGSADTAAADPFEFDSREPRATASCLLRSRHQLSRQ